MDFWNFVWLIIVSFVFIAYLMMLWSILTDLFRDHKTSGWAKAVWVVFLFFIPMLTALVYLIVRGHGMAERTQAHYARVQQAQHDYIREIAGQSPSAQIADANALLESGAITESEFQTLKATALA
ncbi:SHOCT domain-containing protein [Dietzia sp. ANT_WB102]|uniref:SHOCT domain-containing protein n=1 Tax=Dietzia sp. ANT_WB102 TaxID=2597345 RepID=UPI0011EDEB28|nr:SHOCT domain-containing protein [Dietzia sp. ANT_WB102]KAA0919914.1 hypothetical protein FQ137_03340 [Dietzia sp. ANT_WB102]